MSVYFIYCKQCGLVRKIPYGVCVNICDCGTTFTRVSMSDDEYSIYKPRIDEYGFIEFMNLYDIVEL